VPTNNCIPCGQNTPLSIKTFGDGSLNAAECRDFGRGSDAEQLVVRWSISERASRVKARFSIFLHLAVVWRTYAPRRPALATVSTRTTSPCGRALLFSQRSCLVRCEASCGRSFRMRPRPYPSLRECVCPCGQPLGHAPRASGRQGWQAGRDEASDTDDACCGCLAGRGAALITETPAQTGESMDQLELAPRREDPRARRRRIGTTIMRLLSPRCRARRRPLDPSGHFRILVLAR